MGQALAKLLAKLCRHDCISDCIGATACSIRAVPHGSRTAPDEPSQGFLEEHLTPSGNPLPPVVHQRLTTGHTGPLRAEGRAVVVGDLHGCIHELRALLRAVRFKAGQDCLIAAGDVVAKGPHSDQVVRALRELGALCVRGNWDDDALAARAAWRRGEPPPPELAFVSGLPGADERYLSRLPFSLSLPEYGVVVVHAGLVPGVPLQGQSLVDIYTMRVVWRDKHGDWHAYDENTPPPAGALPWAQSWPGPTHVVFAHDARRGLQLEHYATGVDTGCVTGGRLTALVLPPLRELRRDAAFRNKLEAGEPLTLRDLSAHIVSVPSQQPAPPGATG